MLAKLMAVIGAGGLNGHTMGAVPLAFRIVSDKTGHPIVFEPEGGNTGDNKDAVPDS